MGSPRDEGEARKGAVALAERKRESERAYPDLGPYQVLATRCNRRARHAAVDDSLEVPDEILAKRQLSGDIGDEFGFRQYWLSLEVANSFRDSLVIYDSETEEEVRPDLVGK